MRSLLILIATGVSALAQSNAVTSLAYGPQTFNTQIGGLPTQTATFTLPALVDGPYTLTFSGDDSNVRGNIATISLNGNVLFGPGPLKHNTVQQTVPLIAPQDGTNILEVTLGEQARVTISITGYSYKFAADYAQPGTITIPPPDDIDWRQKGTVTPVKNQGSCQADWAFSATGVVEGAGQISTGTLNNLSEQQVLDCTPHVKSCSDGSPVRALLYLLGESADDGGSASELSYPYTGQIGKCRDRSVVPAVQISSATILPSGEQYLSAQVNRQPVSVVVNGNWFSKCFGNKCTGQPVVDQSVLATCGTVPPEYHAMLVVGQTGQFWMVKNSLGTSWGAQGYIYLPRGKNICGIDNYLSVAQ